MDDDYLPPGIWGWLLLAFIVIGDLILVPIAVAMYAKAVLL